MQTPLLRLGAIGLMGTAFLASIGAEPAIANHDGKSEPPVQMEAIKVAGSYRPKLSFGLSLDVWKDNLSQQATSIVVGAVRAGSEAERKNLTPRMRVLRIDGKLVQDFEASFLTGTELNQIFVDRRNGAQVSLEVWDPAARATRTVVLTEQRNILVNLPSKLNPLQN